MDTGTLLALGLKNQIKKQIKSPFQVFVGLGKDAGPQEKAPTKSIGLPEKLKALRTRRKPMEHPLRGKVKGYQSGSSLSNKLLPIRIAFISLFLESFEAEKCMGKGL